MTEFPKRPACPPWQARTLGRRVVLTGGGALLIAAGAPGGARAATSIRLLERRHGGRLGLFALDLERKRTIGHRADERFKLYSTFKGLLAALVLRDVQDGLESLDATVTFVRGDLLAASPVTTAQVDRGRMTVRELCEAMMHRSDNAAANLLMRRRGGPVRLTGFIRSLGDRRTRVDSYEGQIEGRPAAFDTTTPSAMVEAQRKLLFGGALAPEGGAQLEAWLRGNAVGGNRLRAAFPPDWTAGDRTGTGDGWCNDYAVVRRAGGAPLVVSAFYHAPGMPLERQEEVLRDAGAIVVDWQRG